MDRILTTLFADFRSAHGFDAAEESEAFEHFVNYCVLFPRLRDTFDLDDVAVGADGNVGIDGLAILVNGALVVSEQDVDALIDSNGYLDVDFVFTQAKTSTKFDLGDIGTFLFAITDFFKDTPQLPVSEAIRDLRTLKDYLYSRTADMVRRNPTVAIHYATAGQWRDDPSLKARFDSTTAELRDSQNFSEVTATPYGSRELQALYRDTKGKSKATFTFSWKVTLPIALDNVSEAHFGIISSDEFLKIINDSNGVINESLFRDNVRDFQDYNPVNKDIRSTITGPDKELFPLLNNGVTIIASQIRPTGPTFTIEDYQIVNGCQTSHVLFNDRTQLGPKVYIPIKLIGTQEDAVVNRIIKAANFQTAIKAEQLYALSDFQKTLEDFYATFPPELRLYYERRARQYARDASVPKVRTVSIQTQIRVFTSMFLTEPHRGHYPKAMGSAIGRQLFGKDHLPDPYYIAAFCHFRLETFFRNTSIAKSYKPARYHLLLALRRILEPGPLPAFSSREMCRICERLLSKIKDDASLLKALNQATSILDSTCGKRTLDRSLTKTGQFTKEFETKLEASLDTGGNSSTGARTAKKASKKAAKKSVAKRVRR